MVQMRYQKLQYFIRGVEKIRKAENYKKFLENEEMQNVKKTIGESTISESTTVVVVKPVSGCTAVCGREAKNKKNVIPTLGGNDGRRRWGTTTIIYKIIMTSTHTKQKKKRRSSAISDRQRLLKTYFKKIENGKQTCSIS